MKNKNELIYFNIIKSTMIIVIICLLLGIIFDLKANLTIVELDKTFNEISSLYGIPYMSMHSEFNIFLDILLIILLSVILLFVSFIKINKQDTKK